MEGIIQHNPELQREAEVQSKSIFMDNGTTITAMSGDYAGAAGSNHGFVSYDELWAYTSESSTRLWEELTPVPTRRNSIRFVSTYSGFHGESQLLWDLYRQAVATNEHPEGQGERIHPDLPIYANREACLFAYWDHEPRMPWQTQEYYDSQKRLCGLEPIFVYMRISGPYRRKHSSRRRCGTRALINPIIQAQPSVSRSLSASTWESSMITRRVWLLNGTRPAGS
jgi:hypothetical protein